ncbi:MAG: transglutaminase domain-containing protein, partial [candidate division WOR-3 bacterium]
EMKLKGEIIGTKLKLYYKERVEEIELGEVAFLPVTLEAFLKEKKIKEGEKISFRMFDPSVKQVADAILFYKGKEKIDYKNKKIETDVYEYEFAGIKQRIYLKDNEIIKEELPFDMVLLKEEKNEAIKISEKPIDILFKYAVKPKGKKVSLMANKIIYKLSNIDPSILDLEFGNQRLIEKGKDYAIIEVEKPQIEEVKELIINEELKDYLKPTLFIQSDNEEIRDSALKWAKGENYTQKSKNLMHKVFTYLSKEASVTIPSAIEVLHNKKGDCNEHSILYTSLLRAIGIPSEIVVGLIYQEGYFWYHAWNAVYLNKWVFVDPTYFEFPASCLHIMLKMGEIEKQAEVAGIVGKIEIEVIEISEGS